MGSIVIKIPDFEDDQLVFDASETKQIPCFFWPSRQLAINAFEINNNMRRLAQTALIASIEGTFAMGIIDITLQSLNGAHRLNVAKWARKLASKLTRYAWKHAQHKDLKDVRIYSSIRDTVANNLRSNVDMGLNGASLQRGSRQIYARVPAQRAAGCGQTHAAQVPGRSGRLKAVQLMEAVAR